MAYLHKVLAKQQNMRRSEDESIGLDFPANKSAFSCWFAVLCNIATIFYKIIQPEKRAVEPDSELTVVDT